MPLFTFKCQNCDESFEKLMSFSQSTDKVDCPQCRGHNTQKQLSLVARALPLSSSGATFSSPGAACAPGST